MSWSSLFALLIIAMHAHDEVCARCLHDKCLQTRHGSVCTHCETGYVPLEGRCTATDVSFCLVESEGGGTCSQCAYGYRGLLNGCYPVPLFGVLDGNVSAASAFYISTHVLLNGQILFTGCFANNELPINGVCAEDTDNWCAQSGETDFSYGTSCLRCTGTNVFYFKGGCYNTKTEPGSLICKAALDGVCTACNTDSGYVFENPSTGTKTDQCISCGDGYGADGYSGVESCKTCVAPSGNSKIATCSACPDGYKFNIAHTRCFNCALQGCLNCDGYDSCEHCDTGFFMADQSYSKICVTTCPSGTFPFVNSTGYNKCFSCSSSDGSDSIAVERIPGCETCAVGSGNLLTCSACLQGYQLTPTGCKQVCADVLGCGLDACTVVIGSMSYCSKCKSTNNYAPINGVCEYVSMNDKSGCRREETIAGVCPQCGEGYFLHMNGCYKADQAPGNLVCSSVGTGSRSLRNAGAGLCSVCGSGYRAKHGRCISCNKQHCLEYIPNTCVCTLCEDNVLLIQGECVSFPSSGCKVPYCALCEKKLEVCTRCEASYYITPLHGCTKDCEDLMGYHNNADLGKCVRCRIRNCYKCYDSARCSECSTGYGLTDNQQCVRCPKNCFACAHHNKCTTCKSGYILSDSEVCESEDEYKVDCKHADAKYIKYEFARHIKGSVRQRLTASMCSECNAGKVPINGKCVSVSAKAPSCTPGTGENAGKCTRCISSGSSNSTFLYSGGCYDSNTNVGKSLCASVGDNGLCARCPRGGFMLDTSRNECVPCPMNCMKCNSSGCLRCDSGWLLIESECVPCKKGCLECGSSSDKCTSCITGYYVAGATTSSGKEGICRRCDDTQEVDGWKGIQGCTLCTPPVFAGEVLCLSKEVIEDVVTRSLSSGVVAGISITIVVVVAAIVGVLVWKYVCKKKSSKRIKMVDMDVSINTSQYMSTSTV
ncbi:High cysteine membrane protein Group 1 [Giardia duodenalis]|uniref:High cysteine membrane protein Group 1 n=1 Tax=Giardia intestinalis (strain ATCC 50803 / WB clone C6) TaxID=184922 RepID=A8BEQ4_GIAIC|nr:High cysteine membrane protein Group 1 [Giardia intestinalis]KAE8305752.1 High cysteine membrane protein Group 1 [Giardia intestinalis]|eukprot:XP_001707403.1 High cysteine membrane protein Group 1 [Giardia lamblia ATCC 50803]